MNVLAAVAEPCRLHTSNRSLKQYSWKRSGENWHGCPEKAREAGLDEIDYLFRQLGSIERMHSLLSGCFTLPKYYVAPPFGALIKRVIHKTWTLFQPKEHVGAGIQEILARNFSLELENNDLCIHSMLASYGRSIERII